MRIAFVLRGVGRMELNLAGGLIGRGHDVDFILLEARIPYTVPPEIRLFGVEPVPKNASPEAARRRGMTRVVGLDARGDSQGTGCAWRVP